MGDDNDAQEAAFGSRRARTRTREAVPIRVLRGVTVHRVQGQTLRRLLLSLGAKERAGVTYTAFSRGVGPDSIILQRPYDDARLVTKVNNFRERFPQSALEPRLLAMH